MTNRLPSTATAALLALVLTTFSCVCAPATPVRKVQNPAVEYICPMDPEVKSASPGKCPRCGMTLRQSAAPTGNERETASGNYDSTRKPLLIPDSVVYDQNRRKLNFYSDLVKGKTVAINFLFTTCTTICPPLAATFRKVQTEIGSGVDLISISVDPVTDVPDRLKSFLAKFNAGPGWTFVTGEKPEIDSLLRALGAYVGDKNEHSPAVVIVNDKTGFWTRAYGLSSPATLINIIREAAGPVARN